MARLLPETRGAGCHRTGCHPPARLPRASSDGRQPAMAVVQPLMTTRQTPLPEIRLVSQSRAPHDNAACPERFHTCRSPIPPA
jgi:hypothetical protein